MLNLHKSLCKPSPCNSLAGFTMIQHQNISTCLLLLFANPQFAKKNYLGPSWMSKSKLQEKKKKQSRTISRLKQFYQLVVSWESWLCNLPKCGISWYVLVYLLSIFMACNLIQQKTGPTTSTPFASHTHTHRLHRLPPPAEILCP